MSPAYIQSRTILAGQTIAGAPPVWHTYRHEHQRPPNSRRCPQGREGRRHRVPVRELRRHARETERQADPGRGARVAVHRRRRLRRVRRRRHRPAAERPRPDRDARRRLLHEAALEAQRRLVRLGRHRRGRGVAVLPAHDPAPPDEALRGRGLPVQDRLRARVLPAAQDGGRRHQDRRRPRHPRASLLRHPCPDPELRLRLRRHQERQLAGMGAVRNRPRGRQWAVRAELWSRRPPDQR